MHRLLSLLRQMTEIDITNGEFTEDFVRFRLAWHGKILKQGDWIDRFPELLIVDDPQWICSAALDKDGGRIVKFSTGTLKNLSRFYNHCFANAVSLGFRRFSEMPEMRPRKFDSIEELKQHSWYTQTPIRPTEPIEQYIIGFGMALIALDCLLAHEIAHHVLGHLEVKLANQLKTRFEMQALEYEADSFAGSYLHTLLYKDPNYQPFGDLVHVSDFSENRFGKNSSRRYLAMVSISLLFHLTKKEDWPCTKLPNGGHPPQKVRWLGILAFVAGYPDIHDDIARDMIDISEKEAYCIARDVIPNTPEPADISSDALQVLKDYNDVLGNAYVRVRNDLYDRT